MTDNSKTTVWQPIETAPKSRNPILLIGEYPTGRGWSDIYQCWWDGNQGGRGKGGWVRWPNSFQPSHWMPSPPPPMEDQTP